MTFLRAFPTEIESDLSRYHHVDVGAWWRGQISSRFVLARLRHLPDESAFKTGLREGDWSEQQYVAARGVNEVMFLRADQAAIHAGHKMKAQPLESPAQRKSKKERDQSYRDLRSDLLAKIGGDPAPISSSDVPIGNPSEEVNRP